MAKKTSPSNAVPGGTSSKTVPQHKRLAEGEKITGQNMKKGGKVEKMSRGGRGC
jgi:hypothetical protein